MYVSPLDLSLPVTLQTGFPWLLVSGMTLLASPRRSDSTPNMDPWPRP